MNASDSTPETPIDNGSIEYHPAESDIIRNNEFSVDPNILAQEALFDTNVYFHLDENEMGNDPNDVSGLEYENGTNAEELAADLSRIASIRDSHAEVSNRDDRGCDRPPIWIPDVEAPKCMSCGANFTVVKRRHHCRNCGKVFCARCSSNSVPLPKYGHIKPVRVCNKCFIYHLTPFTM